jgi:hypothetical protein
MVDSKKIQKSDNKGIKNDSNINTNLSDREKRMLLNNDCKPDVTINNGLGHLYGSW